MGVDSVTEHAPGAPAFPALGVPALGVPALRLTLRIDVGGRRTLGPGKVRLLELVGQHGSISGAARAMGMSYRRAWTLVESLNGDFGAKLVAAKPGGAGGGGAQLLPEGAEVVRLYRALEACAGEAGREALARLGELLATAPAPGSATER